MKFESAGRNQQSTGAGLGADGAPSGRLAKLLGIAADLGFALSLLLVLTGSGGTGIAAGMAIALVSLAAIAIVAVQLQRFRSVPVAVPARPRALAAPSAGGQ